MIFNIEKAEIIESGATGIWKWQKYKDNTVEFFGKIPILNHDITMAFSDWYRGATLYESTTYEYPFVMTEVVSN